jgi:aminoglycoside/choline kinase family phosphotransferase
MNEKQIENILKNLFKKYFYESPKSIKRITGGVSGRIIFKITSPNYICIGVHNCKIHENRAFIEFSKIFLGAGLNVPQIFCVSDNMEYYLEEFLGEKSLFELIKSKSLTEKEKLRLYKNALSDLIQFQIRGKDIINYKLCYETRSFDKKQIYFDFCKFNYYFLNKLADLDYSKAGINRLKKMIYEELAKEKNSYFMYRDFQPRNIMYKEDELSYIDFQSGRKGPLQYDLASFLYSGSIDITERQRRSLLDYYIKEVSEFTKINPVKFKKSFYSFAFIRLLQVLGSYGFLYETKKDKNALKKIKRAKMNLQSIIQKIEIEELIIFAGEIVQSPIRISKHR